LDQVPHVGFDAPLIEWAIVAFICLVRSQSAVAAIDFQKRLNDRRNVFVLQPITHLSTLSEDI